jgi:hypothetical protein
MRRTVESLGDRLLARLVPRTTARAAQKHCWIWCCPAYCKVCCTTDCGC